MRQFLWGNACARCTERRWITRLPKGSILRAIKEFPCNISPPMYLSNDSPNCVSSPLIWKSPVYESKPSCCCTVTKSCLTLCNPMDSSMPVHVLHVLHGGCQAPLSSTVSQSLLKFMSFESVMLSNHLSHPLPPPSPFAFNLSQHQGLFQRVGSSHQVAKVLELQLQ